MNLIIFIFCVINCVLLTVSAIPSGDLTEKHVELNGVATDFESKSAILLPGAITDDEIG